MTVLTRLAFLLFSSAVLHAGDSKPETGERRGAVDDSGEKRDGIRVDADFPGGNIIVEEIEGDQVSIHQDLRDTKGDWFYWSFRVRGAQGKELTFRFTGGPVIGNRGPAVSAEGGTEWRWLGPEAVKGTSFRFAFPPGAGDTRFCLAFPYLEAQLLEFLERHEGHPSLKVATLCRSRRGRRVRRLHVGRVEGSCDHRVLVACRHHACEMMASHVLEGLLEAVLSGTEDAKWLCRHVEFLVVPFMDKDGVQDGDQGKNRKPHDHNRDYAGDSIYPSVRALRELVPDWSDGRLSVALDLHCPTLRGRYNEQIYLVGQPGEALWQRVRHFSRILEESRKGPLPYRASDNLPFGKAWNTNRGPLKSFARWAGELPGVQVAATIEIPYANVGDVTVTPGNARSFGKDLARALRRYLEQLGVGD